MPYTRRKYPTKQQRANREAQQSGVNAEYLVEQRSVIYEAQMLARVRKRHEPYRRVGGVGKNGMFKAINTGASGCDFELWLSDGRAGMMEVKSRKAPRIQLSCVGDAQALDLTRLSHWGHLALVLVRLVDSWYLIDYRAWTHESKRSLNADDLAKQGARVDLDEHGHPMFIEAIDRAILTADQYTQSL
tara:strand:- start:751 stop:1314 length:564 start_codon:yes stop_codon:yes gene_type:complete